MATISSSLLDSEFRPGSGWTLVSAQVLGQLPSKTPVTTHRMAVNVPEVFGFSIGSAPDPQQLAQQAVRSGQASSVPYAEVWSQGHTLLGTGYTTFVVLLVYA